MLRLHADNTFFITFLGFIHRFYKYPFHGLTSFFMRSKQRAGAGGKLAQSIKTYGRCSHSLYLLFSLNEWTTSSLMAVSSDASHAATGCFFFFFFFFFFCCECSQPLKVQINEQKKWWRVGGDGASSPRLCGRLLERCLQTLFAPGWLWLPSSGNLSQASSGGDVADAVTLALQRVL